MLINRQNSLPRTEVKQPAESFLAEAGGQYRAARRVRSLNHQGSFPKNNAYITRVPRRTVAQCATEMTLDGLHDGPDSTFADEAEDMCDHIWCYMADSQVIFVSNSYYLLANHIDHVI